MCKCHLYLHQKIKMNYYFCKYKCLSLCQVSDTGQYVCKATNVAGQVDKNFHLSIHGEKKNIYIINMSYINKCMYIYCNIIHVFTVIFVILKYPC